MWRATQSYGGMVTAPHHLAAQTGRNVLAEGGNAIEAMLAMAASIAVVYPHMNGIGGDGFWLIKAPGAAPVAISACGPAAAGLEAYAGLKEIPTRGPLAALTVPGTVSGWGLAHRMAQSHGGKMPLSRLFAEAIAHAKNGFAVSESQATLTRAKAHELQDVTGFAATFMPGGRAPEKGARMALPALAATLERLAEAGTDDFYRGDLARSFARELEAAGAPVRLADLDGYNASLVKPLSVRLADAQIWNLPPPTQGASALAILALLDRIRTENPSPHSEEQFIHDAVEATKAAFALRNAALFDPAYMRMAPEDLVSPAQITQMAAQIDRNRAGAWPVISAGGDTVWMGAIDHDGLAVSFIQSVYWEFGSGVTLGETGVQWQNRGISFSLEPGHANQLRPGRLPFHTLNPALASFDDGRTMAYGTMGGEGQPQTQAAIFARYAWQGFDLQQAISEPRWLLGRTWGDQTTNLKLEQQMFDRREDGLEARGHDIAAVADLNDMMGHAGAVVRYRSGLFEGASDPRSDGKACGV